MRTLLAAVLALGIGLVSTAGVSALPVNDLTVDDAASMPLVIKTLYDPYRHRYAYYHRPYYHHHYYYHRHYYYHYRPYYHRHYWYRHHYYYLHRHCWWGPYGRRCRWW